MNVNNIIIRPLITEKTEAQKLKTNGLNVYTFLVCKTSNKEQIRQVLKVCYGVDALKVNVLNTMGKQKRFRYKKYQQSGLKKAIVTLTRGQSIELTSKEN